MSRPAKPERTAQIRCLFEELCDLPAEQRAAFLEAACRGDSALRQELSSLLQQADSMSPQFDAFSRDVVLPMVRALRDDPSGLDPLLDEISSASVAPADQLVGRTISHFDVLAPLGRGGMGMVYRARDRNLDRIVALKFLPPAMSADESAKSRFVREARAASALDHPAIATVHEIGETGDHHLFIAMTCYEGETLKQRIDRGALPPGDALAIAIQLAEALAAAHDRGVVHRDVKPGNVMLPPDGGVKLLDFGLAKLAGSGLQTQPGATAGTVAYMSPEQLRGGAVDHRTDIWSLGVVLYEMLAGRRPFPGDNAAATIHAILEHSPDSLQPVPAVTAALQRVIGRCLAQDPERRYVSAGDVAADLQSCEAGTWAGRAWRAVRWRTRKPGTRKGLAAALATIVVAGSIYWTARNHRIVEAPAIDSVAVLPFRDLTGNPEEEYFADGMQEALIGELAKISGLRVISRQSTHRYRNSDLTVPEIARELNVAGIVTATVFRNDDDVHLRVQLTQAEPEERPRYTQAFTETTSHVFTMHNQVARQMADEMKIRLTTEDESRLDQPRTITPESYAAYLRGMYYLNKSTPEDFAQGMVHFQSAIEKNPADPFAYAGLAQGYLTMGHGPGADPDALPKAQAALNRALRLDPTLVEAHISLAELKLYHDWDMAGFETAARRVLELNPNSAMMHYHLAWYHVLCGDLEAALAEHRRARELDPLTPLHTVWIPGVYYCLDQPEQALASAAETDRHFPNHAVTLFVQGLSAAQLARFDFAVERHRQLVDANPEWLWVLGWTYAVAGRTAEARTVQAEWEQQPAAPWTSLGRAAIHAALGEADEAFRWLNERPAHSWVPWVGRLPMFASLRNDPRLAAFLVEHHLPPLSRSVSGATAFESETPQQRTSPENQ